MKKNIKKEFNISRYNARCEAIREKQRLANELRKQFGYVGDTPDKVLAEHAAYLAAKQEAERNQFLHRVLYESGRASVTIRNWLKVRIHREPSEVLALVKSFLERPQNLSIKMAVEANFAKAA